MREDEAVRRLMTIPGVADELPARGPRAFALPPRARHVPRLRGMGRAHAA